MRRDHVQYLVCPRCQGKLTLSGAEDHVDGDLQSGQLGCAACNASYSILRGISRFVPIENYASGFGLEWTRHARTQYDSYSGLPVSERRFFEETRWPRDLSGETILEVGSGSGRFTEQAASTGAMVVSMDYSYAVEANYQSNGNRENVLIVQGDVYQMPFRRASFDRLFCFGMLQHTPDPRKAFFALPPMLKPSGHLVADSYQKTFAAYVLGTKYYARFLTRNMDPERLSRWTERWVDRMWPISRLMGKIPKIGTSLNWRLLVADYTWLGLREDLAKEWAYLDTLDMLVPRYDAPQTLKTMRRWFRQGWPGQRRRALRIQRDRRARAASAGREMIEGQ